MSIALYRKYRPATFVEVRGQEHVTEPLRQALRNGRINHAYLFSGPRGCGKTTSARILARSLNCDQGPTPDPCGTCDSCVALGPDGAGSIDVIEIDAASHGGVDDARDLRERAFFAPVSSRYKVYIIDEAHMVTREGFNALLKLVEEPPPHLKFVFATTEPDKVIGTIRSRTHHYPFRLIPPRTLRELLEEVLTEEGVPFDAAALPLVVRAGAGSARDSLSILDQLLAGSGADGITRDGAVGLLGFTDSSLLTEMVDALGARDGAAVFSLIDRVMEGGHDPRRFTTDLLERIRDLVVLAAVPDALDKGLINVAPDAVERMTDQATRLGPGELTRAAEILNRGLTEMRGATSPRLLLELMCARVLLPAADPNDGGGLLARLDHLESRVSSGAAASAAGPPAAPEQPARARPEPAANAARPRPDAANAQAAPTADTGPRVEQAPPAEPAPEPPADDWPDTAVPGGGGSAERPRPAPAPPAPPAQPAKDGGGGAISVAALRNQWPQILEAVKQRRKATWTVITGFNVEVTGVEGNTVQLGFERATDARGFSNSGSADVVAGAIHQVFGVEMQVVAVPLNGGGSAARRQAAPQAPAPEPARPEPAARPSPAPAPEPPPDPAWEAGVPEPPPPEDLPPPPEPPDPEPGPDPDVPDPGNDPPAAGFALIETELGGKVVEEIDHRGD
ncbi:DNA polymerase-3 subunit gamma/tau [Lipingzhangella halophila]|uniref:DNA polymerase III subunit gamma/tau n=1 Tax=Lipingzhangella halophila TaxID=1783352 RepID=A0A7W7W651_9ACTN|nr:DNA polymerase III subunit gamma and tau [Lipingzhangella halophila]MBB4935371.1 DNA polymerase-3 subunit gamma/tau [Lipingzhangella halophila]